MIPRYSLPDMEAIWSDQRRLDLWLEIELTVCRVLAERGEIPAEALQDLEERAQVDVERVAAIEAEVKHEVIAFLTAVTEEVGEAGRYLHIGLTSSDVIDTGLALQLRQAGLLLLNDLDAVLEVVKGRAVEEKETVMVGRTHGVHAEPISLGLKFALWFDELRRGRQRLERALDEVSCGKLSGAVGTYAHLEPSIEEAVCRALNLKPAAISSQIIQRDRHAAFVAALGILGSSLDRMTTEVRHLQRTEVLEVEEPFTEDQKGSSSMPHKKNPTLSERISGLARVLRGQVLTALENQPLWHERDISHSSAERFILPDATGILHYMLTVFREILEGLAIHRDRMAANLEMTGGLVYSQALLLELIRAGLSREDAYRIVQRHAFQAADTGSDFASLVEGNPEITERISREDLRALFTPERYLRHTNAIFQRLGLGADGTS